MSPSLLHIRDLSTGYGHHLVLQNIHCTIQPGEVISVIGPNGSGKTTFLRAITRILRPRRGEVLLEGKNIWDLTPKQVARKMAVAAQSVDPPMITVEQYVRLGRLPHLRKYQFFESRADLTVVERYMELTNILRHRHHLMMEVSGGERQLASIARALAQEPTLLLLDEPTAHLDITHQAKILDLIKRLNSELGITVLMVLHDLNLASEYSDRLVLLHHGTIHRMGRPEEVLTYEAIEEVYKTVVIVQKSPLTGKPYIFLITEEAMKREQSADHRGL